MSEMFKAAHKQAKLDHKKFGGDYRVRFGNALAGFYAVRRGFRGVDLVEPERVWG